MITKALLMALSSGIRSAMTRISATNMNVFGNHLFNTPSLSRLPRYSPFTCSFGIIESRSIFIETESTPNPHSMKFVPGQEILPPTYGTGMYFERSSSTTSAITNLNKSPLAKELFSVEGVKSIFLGQSFITITKDTKYAWQPMKPQVFAKILDFFASDTPVVIDNPLVSDTTILDTDDEVVATIKELIEARIRPSVQEDGGDIFYAGFDEITGIVKVRLAGSCVGCPSSSITLRNGVENMLMHYVQEVKGIEDVTMEEPEAEQHQ